MALSKYALAVIVAALTASGVEAKSAPTKSAQAGAGFAVQKLIVMPKPASAEQEYACTADRVWCVSRPVVADGEDPGAASILHMENGDLRYLGSIQLRAPEFTTDVDAAAADYAPWHSIIRFTPKGEAEIALIGITQTQNAMYSGGGASVTHLLAYEARANHPGDFRFAFDAPYSSDITIRACFSENDVKQRLEACADQYTFRASLVPAAPGSLIYKSQATTYPGIVSRGEDSTAAPPLKKSDLRQAVNAQCSVTRTLSRDPTTGAFAWDSPLPACSDFLEP